MANPPTAVRSIRLSVAMWSALQAQADSLGVSLNRYIGMRLESGVKKDLKAAEAVIARRAAPAIHVDVPVYAPKAFNPRPKTQKK